MAFCTNCGKQATGNEKFCTNCGAQLPGAAPQASQQTYRQPVQPAQPTYAPTDQYGYQAPKPAIDKKKLYLLIGAGVAVVAAIVILIVVLTGGGTASLEGDWRLSNISGNVPGLSDVNSIMAMMGMSSIEDLNIIFTFKDGNITMSMSLLGQSQTQKAGTYTKDGGDKLKINGYEYEYKISGKTMTLSDKSSGATITLKKK